MDTNKIPEQIVITNSTLDTYFIKLFFKNYVLSTEYYPYQFDNTIDKKYYGILDTNKNIVYPKQTYLKTYTNSLGAQQKNIVFVADAFKDFKKFHEDLLKKNKLSNNSIYSKLNAYETTADVPNLYLKFLQNLYVIFKNNFLLYDVRNDIKNLDTFIPYFIMFAKYITKVVPLNRSKFIGSRRMPESINGLRISIDNPPKNIDIKQISNNYISNPQFDNFIENAAKFGFYVDKNSPWTLVADLESPVMKKYARNYNLKSLEDIFDTCYHKAYLADLDTLNNIIISFWNNYVLERGATINSISGTNNLFSEVNALNEINNESFEKYYNINWQLRLYLFIRILEDKLDITQNKFEILYKECLTINKIYGKEKSLEYINKKIQEINERFSKKQTVLTSEEEVIKMISKQIKNLPQEGLIF